MGSNRRSNQTNNIKICSCRFLVRPPALLGKGMDWLAYGQGNMIEWDIMSWCWCPGLRVGVGHHYKVSMREQCNRSVHILIWCCQDVKFQQPTNQTKPSNLSIGSTGHTQFRHRSNCHVDDTAGFESTPPASWTSVLTLKSSILTYIITLSTSGWGASSVG